MSTSAVDELTRRQWRDLGFFYKRDDTRRVWTVIGDRDGLRRLAAVIRGYARDSRYAAYGTHDHFGPYMYLKLMTWPDTGINGNAIHGPTARLTLLADVIEERLVAAATGNRISLRDKFAQDAEYDLVVELRSDGFDPAGEDAQLGGAG
jgi:hypothetical protein